MVNELKQLKVSEVFANTNYLVPIYQRNYAWGETQIEQLIEDIESSIDGSDKNYFLGNLIVNQTDNNVYEVIDGQQRLTTLYLLEKYLGIPFAKETLRFEAREKSNRTLAYVSDSGNQELTEELSSTEILNGFRIVDNHFKNRNIDKGSFAQKLKHVYLIRVQVPKNIDLNHYFEIMNTRGEQLELHEIAKAKLLEVLESDHDKYIAAMIWEKCSDMNSYVQMNFDVNVRRSIFTENWSGLCQSSRDFDSIKSKIPATNESTDKKPLIDILRDNKMLNESNKQSEDENERFESFVSFPNFLLQVNAVMRKLGEEDASLDDKYFLNNISWAWATPEKAKDFLFYLLKCRVLFDKYVLKREFARDYKETGKWSLQRLEKYRDIKKNSDNPKYISTFGDEDNYNKKLRTLQSATPERMDGKSIYEICDYNVPYEISLKEAINKGMLVPFHYYGIYDETDYSALHVVRGKYDENELDRAYIGNIKRYDTIYKYYRKYRSRRALGFCCSRKHAEAMAKEFCERGIPSVAVYSNADGEYSEDRDKAIQKLKNQEIKVIFSVDMFNEGLDISSLDMVMFLRPTESPIVFLQQLGRGLRTCKGKEYLNVLDFIGNYEKAGKAPLLLGGAKSFSDQKTYDYNDMEYPDDCLVDFDMRLIDLFRELDKKSLSVKVRIAQEYYRVKDLLEGRVPTRMELLTYMEDEVYQYCMKHAKENPFCRYLEFLNDRQELTEAETELYNGIGREFISVIETTGMQKVYKMPILYSFYNDGNIRLEVTDEKVLDAWKRFFNTGTNWRDFAPDIAYEDYKSMTDKQHLAKAKAMPIKFLKASGKGFFIEKDGYAIAIRADLKDVIKTAVFEQQMKDILEYRTMEYYRRRYMGD